MLDDSPCVPHRQSTHRWVKLGGEGAATGAAPAVHAQGWLSDGGGALQQVSHSLQLQPLWVVPTAAVS